MKTFKLLAASLLIAVCAGFNACGDDELEKSHWNQLKTKLQLVVLLLILKLMVEKKHCPFQPIEIGLQLLPIQLMVRNGVQLLL